MTQSENKSKVCYYYDSKKVRVAKKNPYVMFLLYAILFVKWNNVLKFDCRWHRQLLLWARSPYEAAPYSYGSQPFVKLWLVPKDGSLRENFSFASLHLKTAAVAVVTLTIAPFCYIYVYPFRDPARQCLKTWRSITVTSTSCFWKASSQITCLTLTSRCSGVRFFYF